MNYILNICKNYFGLINGKIKIHLNQINIFYHQVQSNKILTCSVCAKFGTIR